MSLVAGGFRPLNRSLISGIALYSGVKAFLDQVTRIAAIEFAARRITVNAVAPGSTATGPFAYLTAEQRAAAGGQHGPIRVDG